ncbi:MAG: ATP-binding cassette domain-containing protein [Microbacterium pygmaeum]
MTAALAAHVVVVRPGFRLDATLDAAPGEIVAIMGPSGAGKSTLLATIAGLERLSDGSVSIGDDMVASKGRHTRPEKRGVALLGQDPRLFPHLSARENIAFGPRARGTDRTTARADADEWLWRVGLDGSGDRRPGQLSGGQQQRVAIARALAAAPRLLLLDEPLTSLDTETAGEIRGVLQTQLAAAGTTTVFATHDAVDAVAVASRLAILEAGSLTQTGPVRDVLGAPASRFAASVAGVNRVVGEAHRGMWRAIGVRPGVVLAGTDAAGERASAESADGGPLAAVFRADAVRLSSAAESSWTGALRLAESEAPTPGAWIARVERLEQTLGGVRVHTAEPPIAVDLPTEAVALLHLSPGTPVRLRVEAADVRLQPM